MAEKVASQALVLQIEKEKFFSKLQNMRLNNLTAKQQEELLYHRIKFANYFINLSYIFFGLSRGQLREFSDNEFIMLNELIDKKTKLWAVVSQVFVFGVPIVGWIFGLLCVSEKDFHSWHYSRHKKHLKKVCGKDYFPFEELKLKLKK